ncbi:MAG: CHAT domain-containing protein [Gammaproteobacteria bacterium]|jgi:tetratricopeptide (TPR) repeat protein|nr:CHAT domain-containing protein [Gammaproteobacteria bacterium]
MTRSTAFGALSAILWWLASPGAALAEEPGFTLGADDVFGSVAPCAQARNRGVDIIAEYLDADGDVRFRAGSWLGRDGRYLLPVPGEAVEAIRFRSLEDFPIEPAEVTLAPCPPDFPGTAADSLSRAIDLRLDRYLGAGADDVDAGEAYRDAIEALSSTSHRHWLAVAHFEFASFLRAADRLDEAGDHYLAAQTIFDALDDAGGRAAAINSLGLVDLRQGQLEEAATRFRMAEPLFIELGDQTAVAGANNNLGLVHMRLDQLAEAAVHFEVALTILQGPIDLRSNAPDPEADAAPTDPAAELTWALNTLNNLAIVRGQQGDSALAERYWRNVLALEGHVTRARTGAEARHNLAGLLIRQGRLDEALPLLSQAKERFDADGARRWMSEVRVRLSQLYARLGDTESALHYAQEAVDLEPEDLNARLRALRNLADLQQDLADYPAAVAAIDAALALVADRPESRQHRMLESRRAHVRLLDGRSDRAVGIQESIHRAMARHEQPGEAAIVAYRLALALIEAGRPDEAEPLLHDALEVFRETRRVFRELLVLEALVRLHDGDETARLDASTRAFERALDLRRQSLGDIRRLGLSATLGRIDDRHVRLLASLDRPEQAWAASARIRAAESIDLRLAQRRGRTRATRQDLLDRHGELMTRLHEIRLAGTADSAASGLLLQIDEIESRLRGLDEAAGTTPPPDLAAVQAQLGAERALLSYYLTPEGSLLWTVSADGIRQFELPGSGRIEAGVSSLLARLRHPRQAVGAIGRLAGELGDLLAGPASGVIENVEEILIEPHGNLQALPFGLLAVDGTLLGDRVTLRRIAALAPATEPSPPGADARMIVLANPGWQSDDAPATPFPERSLVGQLMRSGMLTGLPGTQREAELLAALDDGAVDVRVRTGRAASRQFLLEGGLGGYPLIHIATHGLVDLEYPGLSALLLADENGPGPSLLRPMDIAELSLQARLVVLSGCETGKGPVPAGGGALSLARPFIVAGARDVLSTLWKIDDARTAEFMQVFYRHLLVDGQSPARALGAAQRHMRRHRATAHPYYWAGFILSGTSLQG